MIKPIPAAEAFRSVMRLTAQGVTVVTTGQGDSRLGLTVSSMTSLAMEPPALLVCINRRSSIHAALAAMPVIAVNLLADDQTDISNAFAGPPDGLARFATGRWNEAPEGAPALDDALGVIFGRIRDRHDWGSHTIFMAEILSARGDAARRPLLYRNGGYTRPD